MGPFLGFALIMFFLLVRRSGPVGGTKVVTVIWIIQMHVFVFSYALSLFPRTYKIIASTEEVLSSALSLALIGFLLWIKAHNSYDVVISGKSTIPSLYARVRIIMLALLHLC